MFVKKKNMSYNNVIFDLDKMAKDGMDKSFASYTDVTSDFVSGKGFENQEATDGMTSDDIVNMLANPESNFEKLSDYLHYQYISNGNIYQLYTIFKALPSLNYQISAFDNTTKKYEESISLANKMLHKVRYEELARDIIGQACLDGGVVAMWVGKKQNMFCYIFDDLNYVFPKYRLNGDWVCVFDLAMLDDMKEVEREVFFTNLAPFVTESMYNKYQGNTSDEEARYIELPQERTSYIRNGDYLRRNQRLATPLGTQALLDLYHKDKLTKLEDSIANRAIRQIAILQLGSDATNKGYINLGNQTRKKIVQGVVKALKANTSTTSNQIPMAVLPEFCKLEFGTIDGIDGLSSSKFETVNKDLAISTGINNSKNISETTSQFYLDLMYKRIGLILVQIEHFFEKLIGLVVSKREADNLQFTFDKSMPLSKSEEAELLYKLEAQGYSVKAIVDRISNLNFDDFLEQSIYEIEELDLRNKIVPPASTYTMKGASDGKDSVDDTSKDKSEDKTDDVSDEKITDKDTEDVTDTPKESDVNE